MKYDKHYLHEMYNATSTEHPKGSDKIETYQHWLERQLLSRIELIDKSSLNTLQSPPLQEQEIAVNRKSRITEMTYPTEFCIWIAWDSSCDFAIHQDENSSIYWTKGAFSNGTEPHISLPELFAYWKNIKDK